MREWFDIVAAFRSLCDAGKPSALATVVGVDGSAYRRPGARMLIAEDGRTWGGVSGGCLERDVAERARGVIAAGRPFLQRYDTTDEALVQRGVSTGCGGTIDVFIQPLSADDPGIIPMLADVLEHARPRTAATVFIAHGNRQNDFGHTIDADDSDVWVAQGGTPTCVFANNAQWASIPTRVTQVVEINDASGSATLFVERLLPPQRLVIIGGGADAMPVLAIAKTLGWRVAVVAARPALSLESRFAAADERYVTPADAPLDGVPICPADAVVVMTHNLARDAAALAALAVRPRYLGLLGPRHRTARVTAPLPPGHPARDAIHSPVGLDIGSETPEEIALSIVAQIQGCLRRGDPTPLELTATCAT